MILQEKLKILTPLQKLAKNVGELGKLIVKMGHSRPLFLYFRLFNSQLTVYKCSILINFCR